MALGKGLAGLHIKVATGLYDPAFLRWNEVKQGYDGFEADVMNELASRGGFTYEFEILAKPANTTWKEAMGIWLRQYDLLTYSWWSVTTEAEMSGYSTPWGFADLSAILGQMRPKPIPISMERRVVLFLSPFHASAWFGFVGLLMLTALVYWFIERWVNEEDFYHRPDDLGWKGLLRSFYASFVQLTGGPCGASPVRASGRILQGSWSLCVLLVVSSYTANLASSLIARPEVPPLQETYEEVMAKNMRICVEDDANIGREFKARFSWYKHIVMVPHGEEIHTLYDSKTSDSKNVCDVSLSTLLKFRQAQNDPAFEGRCGLKPVGLPINSRPGGWMVYLDYDSRCTVLVRDVLRHHFLAMDADGTLNAKLGEHIFKELSTCIAVEEDFDNEQLDLYAFLGIFGIHVAGMLLAILVFACDQGRRNRHHIRRLSQRVSQNVSQSLSGSACADDGAAQVGTQSEDKELTCKEAKPFLEELEQIKGILAEHEETQAKRMEEFVANVASPAPADAVFASGENAPPFSCEAQEAFLSESKVALVSAHRAVLDQLDAITERLAEGVGEQRSEEEQREEKEENFATKQAKMISELLKEVRHAEVRRAKEACKVALELKRSSARQDQLLQLLKTFSEDQMHTL